MMSGRCSAEACHGRPLISSGLVALDVARFSSRGGMQLAVADLDREVANSIERTDIS